MKYILFILFIIAAHYYTTYDIKRIENKTKKGLYEIDVKGKAYFTNDSIAIYLYEPIMESMVIYNITKQSEIYTGYLKTSRKPVRVWVWNKILFIEYKEQKIKLILR